MIKEKLQRDIIYPKTGLKDVLRAFWQGIKSQKWLLALIFLSIIAGSAISIGIPVFYKKFFDIISVSGASAQTAQNLIGIILNILYLNIVMWGFWRIASFGAVIFEGKAIARLKQQTYDYLMDHSHSFFANNFAGSLIQRVNRFARAFESLADRILWDVLPLIVKVLSIILVLFFYNKWIAYIILVWIFFFLVFNVIFAIWKLKYDIAVAETDSRTTGYLSDTIANQNTIQLFASKKLEVEGYKNITNEQAQKSILSWNLSNIIDAVQGFLNFVLQFALFYFAIIFWQKGMISVGVFVMLQSYILSLIDQTWGFSRVIRNIYQAYADAKEMTEILLLPHEIKDKPKAKELSVDKGEIEFRNLSFNFNETRKVLENINLKIKSGEKVALVGPSGAGKSTFVKLLLRLYSPTAGEIIIDGTDISDSTQGSLRKNIAMVPQDTILFHRTLAENIGYGKPGAAREEIENAAKLAHCDEFIKDLPFGLETYVGERGIKLSGGERQRVAIARAILKNAPILVLDEATSSLDSRSEGLIQDALNILIESRTTIVIAHRLSTIKKMDRIVVIDKGKIIEQGSHDELLSRDDSLYKKLWNFQVGGFLTNADDESGDPKKEENDDEEESEDDEDKNRGDVKLVNF